MEKLIVAAWAANGLKADMAPTTAVVPAALNRPRRDIVSATVAMHPGAHIVSSVPAYAWGYRFGYVSGNKRHATQVGGLLPRTNNIT
ncbi:MAG TPA: hypothetical protein VL101_11505 [Nordella sp.]|nr:hypothetical protein [Nordella sp.]